MTTLGADPEQLRQLAQSCARVSSDLNATHSRTTSVLQSTRWVGADAQAFRSMWSSEFTPVIQQLAVRLEALAEHLTAQASDQAEASGLDVGAVGGWRQVAAKLGAWFTENAVLYNSVSGLGISELTGLLATDGDDDRRRMAGIVMAQRLEEMYSPELDGPDAEERRKAVAQDVIDLTRKLSEPISYPGRDEDEAKLASLTLELETRTIRNLKDRHFEWEHARVKRELGESTDPADRSQLEMRMLLLDAEAKRRQAMRDQAKEVYEQTRGKINQYGLPEYLGGTGSEITEALRAVEERGGPMAMAYMADRLNTRGDSELGSKLNRYIQSLSRTKEGQEIATKLRSSLATWGYEVYDDVAEGPSLLKEVVLPTVSTGLDFVPIVGNVKGVVEGAIGYDMTGRELSALERSLGFAGPLGGAVKKGAGAIRAIDTATDAVRATDDVADIARGADEIGDAVHAGDEITDVVGGVDRARALGASGDALDVGFVKGGKADEMSLDRTRVDVDSDLADDLDDIRFTAEGHLERVKVHHIEPVVSGDQLGKLETVLKEDWGTLGHRTELADAWDRSLKRLSSANRDSVAALPAREAEVLGLISAGRRDEAYSAILATRAEGKRLYENVQEKFWSEVRDKNPELVKRWEDAGFEWPASNAAPQIRVRVTKPDGSLVEGFQKVTLEHMTRKSANPFRSIDVDNLTLSLGPENSQVLEKLRKVDRGRDIPAELLADDPIERFIIDYERDLSKAPQ